MRPAEHVSARFRSVARSSQGAQTAVVQLGRRIRALRSAAGLSQVAAAAKAELDPKHWQVMEQGGTNPTVASLVAVARALGVGLNELF